MVETLEQRITELWPRVEATREDSGSNTERAKAIPVLGLEMPTASHQDGRGTRHVEQEDHGLAQDYSQVRRSVSLFSGSSLCVSIHKLVYHHDR